MSEPLPLLRAPEVQRNLVLYQKSATHRPPSWVSLTCVPSAAPQVGSTLERAGWHGTQGSAPQVDLPRGEGAALPQVLADFSLAVFGLRIKVSEGTCNFQNHLFLSWLPTLHPLFYF